MPIRFVVLGRGRDGQIVERWFLRSWHNIDVARAEMRANRNIKRVTTVTLCETCGDLWVAGRCLNKACPSRRPALEATSVH